MVHAARPLVGPRLAAAQCEKQTRRRCCKLHSQHALPAPGRLSPCPGVQPPRQAARRPGPPPAQLGTAAGSRSSARAGRGTSGAAPRWVPLLCATPARVGACAQRGKHGAAGGTSSLRVCVCPSITHMLPSVQASRPGSRAAHLQLQPVLPDASRPQRIHQHPLAIAGGRRLVGTLQLDARAIAALVHPSHAGTAARDGDEDEVEAEVDWLRSKGGCNQGGLWKSAQDDSVLCWLFYRSRFACNANERDCGPLHWPRGPCFGENARSR